MPKVQKHGAGWSFRIQVPDGDTMKQKRYTGYPTKEAAEIAALEEQARVKRGARADAQGHTVETWLEYWYEHIARPRIEATTLDKYRYGIKKIVPVIGYVPLDKLKAAHVQPMAAAWATKYKPATVHMYIEPLRVAINDAIKLELVYRNPCAAVSLPKLTYTQKAVLPIDQVHTLLDAAKGTQAYMPVLLAALTGLRRSEIAGLRWRDVDLAQGALYVTQAVVQGRQVKGTKTASSRRRVALSSELVNELTALREQQPGAEYVCLVDGKPMRAEYLTLALRRLQVKHGLPLVSPHGLRHSHATILLYLRVHPKVVQERLGHSRISVTLDRYSHAVESMQDEAARLLNDTLYPAASVDQDLDQTAPEK